MRRLALDLTTVVALAWIDHKFPSLKHLTIQIFSILYRDNIPGYFNENKVKRLITHNHHITSLHLRFPSVKLLSFVAEKLPNLENLELERIFESDREPVAAHFDNVKKCSIRRSSVSMPKNISFDNLEEFSIDTPMVVSSRWIEFVERSKHLKKLHINYYTKNEDISRLALAHLNVVEIHLDCGIGVQKETIINLIENCEQLQSIQINMIPGLQCNSTVDALREKFSDKYAINNLASHVVLVKNVSGN